MHPDHGNWKYNKTNKNARSTDAHREVVEFCCFETCGWRWLIHHRKGRRFAAKSLAMIGRVSAIVKRRVSYYGYESGFDTNGWVGNYRASVLHRFPWISHKLVAGNLQQLMDPDFSILEKLLYQWIRPRWCLEIRGGLWMFHGSSWIPPKWNEKGHVFMCSWSKNKGLSIFNSAKTRAEK